jgi:hypothetical protein
LNRDSPFVKLNSADEHPVRIDQIWEWTIPNVEVRAIAQTPMERREDYGEIKMEIAAATMLT